MRPFNNSLTVAEHLKEAALAVLHKAALAVLHKAALAAPRKEASEVHRRASELRVGTVHLDLAGLVSVAQDLVANQILPLFIIFSV